MFLRKMGQRVLILHSYRDGRGKVCQQRLGHFRDVDGLERQLAGISQRCPEIDVDPGKLRARARLLLGTQPRPPINGEDRIRRVARALLTYLVEEEDPQVLSAVQADLGLLQDRLSDLVPPPEATSEAGRLRAQLRRARSRLSPRRRRHDSRDENAESYVDTLGQLASAVSLVEAAPLLAERTVRVPTAETRLQYGAVLQKLGRSTEALEQYGRISRLNSYRHFNSASVYWQEERAEESLLYLLRGITLEPRVLEALERKSRGLVVARGGDYWDEFGDLWPEPGRRFALEVWSQMLVRHSVNVALERGVVVRELVPASSRVWLLERALAAAELAPDLTGLTPRETELAMELAD